MFIFTERYTFDAKVQVTMPGGAEFEFTGTFVMPEDETAMFKPLEARDNVGGIEEARDRLADYWIGWSGIQTEDGSELPFSLENRARLLRQRPIRMGVDQALFAAVMDIRAKN